MKKENPKRATLHDVAAAAGVSYQTVSRVINNKTDVSEETRTRILKIMTEMDYHPNRAAQVLSTHRSLTLEVIMLDIRSTGTLPEMVSVAEKMGYHVTFSVITEQELPRRLEQAAARLVDGLILNAPKLKMPYEQLAPLCRGIPFVQIGAEVGSKKPSVVYDQKYGAQLAVQHLIDLGHRNIAHISGPENIIDANARLHGWAKTLQQHGLSTDAVSAAGFDATSGYNALIQLLDNGAKFSAVFAANDWTALGVIHALHDRGYKVPDDISVVGFDDVGASHHFLPPLTTIKQDFNMVGRMAIEYLITLLTKPNTPIYQSVLSPELVLRQSTKRKV